MKKKKPVEIQYLFWKIINEYIIARFANSHETIIHTLELFICLLVISRDLIFSRRFLREKFAYSKYDSRLWERATRVTIILLFYFYNRWYRTIVNCRWPTRSGKPGGGRVRLYTIE